VRFGKIGGFTNEKSNWVFRWQLFPNEKTGELNVKRGNWSFSRFKALSELWKRIKGN